MKLHEYQLKLYFKRYGIPVPEGQVTSIAREAKLITEEIGGPVVVKAQVLTEGRGEAGGIRLARTPDETRLAAAEMLASKIKGIPVRKLLIDEAVNIEKEYYILITFDRATRRPVLMMYDTGEIFIEAAASALYEGLDRVDIDPLIGLRRFQIIDLASRFDVPEKHIRRFVDICQNLYKLFCEMDATLVALNPLAITDDDRMLAIDGKITVDDNAYYRQEMLYDFQPTGAMEPGVIYDARKYGMYYSKMDGDIGCLMNGGGLAMACLDYIRIRGGRPANYLNMSGNVYEEKVITAMDILYQDPQIRVILIDFYGGRSDCSVVAASILKTLPRNLNNLPIIAHFCGNKAEEANALLAGSAVTTVADFPEAVDKAFEITGGLQ